MGLHSIYRTMSGGSTLPRVYRSAGVIVCAVFLTSCAEPTQSKSADPTRALSPVPACVRNLPLSGGDGYVQQLNEEEYWGLLVPAWANHMDDSPEIASCNGVRLMDNPAFADARLDPASRLEGRITYGGGANRLKIVWLRSHRIGDDAAAGPLALMRVVGNHAEAYGVTAFRGNPDKVRFDLERLGGEVVVTAITDDCTGGKGDCDTVLQVFRPRAGRLDAIAQIGLQRVRSAKGLEPGVNGMLTVKLVASPEYTAEGIQIIEEFSISDEAGRKVRRAQIERAYLLNGSDVVETDQSLWERMYLERLSGGSDTPSAVEKTKGSAGSTEPAPSQIKGQSNVATEQQDAGKAKGGKPSVSSTIAVEELR